MRYDGGGGSHETWRDLERKKWEAWKRICSAKAGLMQDACFISGIKCTMEDCLYWKFRTFIRNEPLP